MLNFLFQTRGLPIQLKKIPINQLNPAPYNPRLTLKPGDAAWQKLERSLTEFDLVQPIVWNESTGHVVSGHQRLAVLKHHGQTEIDCVIVHLSLEKEKALNVTLNNSSVGSDWDADKLVDLLSELQDLPDFDATLTGFDPQQLQDLVLTPDFAPNSLPEEANASAKIQATLEIEPDDWEDVERELDTLLSDYPALRLHVRGKSG